MKEKVKEIVKEYTNGEVTIVWKPDLCMHAAFCWKELIEVFNPKARPWVNPVGASTDRIIEQIKRCPSGALGYYMNNSKKDKNSLKETKAEVLTAEVIPDGPLIVCGNIEVKDKNGNITLKSGATAFCRCGASKNKPYCDGSHVAINFKD